MSRVIIIGGGIVGTAVAAELAASGAEVCLLSDRGLGGGATAAGMGHLVALDGDECKLALTTLSLQLWEQIELPPDCEKDRCGTLWVAENDADMATAAGMQQRLAARGVTAKLLDGARVAALEPALRPRLAGGLEVASDAVIYPPNAALWFWKQAATLGARMIEGTASSVEAHRVQLADGRVLEADWVVVAAGDRSSELLPGLPLRPRKGHLLISARGRRFVSHQVVELGYGKTTHSRDTVAVACNVQPRPTGQVLVGSSRQEDTLDPAVEPRVLARMLQRAATFLPRLATLTALRVWTGFRSASSDGAPIIGIVEPGLAVATGHEGLGITMAPGTAQLLRQILAGEACAIDPAPYDPQRSFEDAA
ncbi:MAG: NAD(P)/FAD-dependent oxidoreductase [Alphaproteobacteria bacterium]